MQRWMKENEKKNYVKKSFEQTESIEAVYSLPDTICAPLKSLWWLWNIDNITTGIASC